MTRKDLETKYNIYGNNSDIQLYRKKGDFNYGIGYCGNVSLANGKVLFNGKKYNNVNDLDNALREWGKSLEWPVDTYNPMRNVKSVLKDRLIWYLTEKMKFEDKRVDWDVVYAKNLGPNSSISFKFDGECDDVMVYTTYGDYTFNKTITKEEDGIVFFSTIINSIVLESAKDMIDALSVCTDDVNTEINTFVKSNRNIFGFEKVNFKELMIAKLEDVLKKLKGE